MSERILPEQRRDALYEVGPVRGASPLEERLCPLRAVLLLGGDDGGAADDALVRRGVARRIKHVADVQPHHALGRDEVAFHLVDRLEHLKVPLRVLPSSEPVLHQEARLEVEVAPRIGKDGRVLHRAGLRTHVIVHLELRRDQMLLWHILLEQREVERRGKEVPERAVAVEIGHPDKQHRPVQARSDRHGRRERAKTVAEPVFRVDNHILLAAAAE
mmetsp:Transcript_4418/g.9654  ORF Transcript_4418/g.9654 Transcript_4418/m.9654 type:complete len:216 (-) Transcript_4418:165-812(-)